ncbi:YVTN repeat-like/Quino protein amine dehydrogenase [Mollisia scopiformis]|uniref:YVTN repeat-like/Quino protein amine dehydrogenase n=1 Tax=Mollisia scopiformis TaxID=149040 RepID=A0A194XAT9_MOLSC|nr:YVTN repeat-like/Quino protein amine dehydrogenase [Mollisia scopiformis]KUJ17285.1 YVTN repeat-like/Quino protein amine dehydrogenase [Mollisia scopiformis]
MPSYSSGQFYHDWRYAIKKDFADPSGEPVKYAQDGFRTWGRELHKIPLSEAPNGVSVNTDGSLIAIAAKEDILIYDTTSFSQIMVLKGHVSRIDALAFQPGKPKVLVSSAQNNYAGSAPAEPTIIFWDLDEQKKHPIMEDSEVLKIANQAKDNIVKNLQEAQTRIELSTEEEGRLISAIEPVISRIAKTHSVVNRKFIHGRLQGSFQSEIFSPSGSHFIYLPGNRPISNGKDAWDVKIYSMTTNEDAFTLIGHTDCLMWMGYSPDESMIATVAWDQSMRIWDAATGQQKYVFETKGQNWTGGFSPDSTKFAGTCGNGTFYVYSMVDGTTLVEHTPEAGRGWMRALDWSADNNFVAVGGGHGAGSGILFLYDVEKKQVTQERILSTDACKVDQDTKRFLGGFLECCKVRFVDGGRKVAALTGGDGGIETYDLNTWEKWRFTRPGIDPESEEDVNEDEGKAEESTEKGQKKEKEKAHGGYAMQVWEDQKMGKVFIASMDTDAVRIWDVLMTMGNES